MCDPRARRRHLHESAHRARPPDLQSRRARHLPDRARGRGRRPARTHRRLRHHLRKGSITMPSPASAYGVHSEVGKLRKVLVCAPGLAHSRLTPSNCDDLLFDDVLWVDNARRDHAEFVDRTRERGVEVVELHDLLAQTMAIPEARNWLLDRKITANEVGLGLVED